MVIAVMEDNDYARADYSLADFGRAAPSEYTSIEGNYVRTWWYAGDYITAAKLDNIENGINLNILQEDFTVQGISIGAAVDKKVYHPGTTALDLIKDMLTVRVVPKYTSPTMSLSSSVTSCELGAMISPTIRINFNTGDSGGIKSSSITHDGSTLTTSTSISISNFLMDRDKEFIGTVEYLEGAIKYDNLGDPVPGFIQEGSLTSRLTIKAYRPSFAFCDNVSDVPTSSYIRSKSKYGLNPTKAVRQLLIDILIDRSENHKDKFISPIIYEEMLGMEIKRNGKVEHSASTHDDQVFSMLMALYVWYEGVNLSERFGIKKCSIKTDDGWSSHRGSA